MAEVIGQVDRGHAASTELAFESVSVGDGLGEARLRGCHMRDTRTFNPVLQSADRGQHHRQAG
jgi:hypothetical protein